MQLDLPTFDEQEAHLMRTRDGLTDDQISKRLGISRETVCRRRRRFISKTAALRRICTAEQCPLIELLESETD